MFEYCVRETVFTRSYTCTLQQYLMGCDLNALQPWKCGCQTMGSWEVTYKESTLVHSTSESWRECTIILRSESIHVSVRSLQLCHFFLFIALQPQSATHNVVTHFSCHEEYAPYRAKKSCLFKSQRSLCWPSWSHVADHTRSPRAFFALCGPWRGFSW